MAKEKVNPFRTVAYLLFIIAGAITLFYGTFIFLGLSSFSLMFMLLKFNALSGILFFIGLIYFLLGFLLVGAGYGVKELKHPALFGFLGFLIGLLTFNSVVICLSFIAFIISLMS